MAEETRQSRQRGAHEMPAPHYAERQPAAAWDRLYELTSEAEPDMRAIAELVRQHPALSATVLRTANGSYWGLSRSVTSVDQAVALLGANRIGELTERMRRRAARVGVR